MPHIAPCRRYAALAIACLLTPAGPSASSRQAVPQNPPVFRSGIDLVTVDVTVVDRDGKPVKGLKPEDFVVTLDGKREAVRALDYLEFGSAPGGPSSASGQPSTRATNQATGGAQSRGGRVMLLVIDDLSARPTQMTGLRTAAQRMLATLDAGDLVGVATTSGLGPVVNPTRDRAAVAAALGSKDVVGRYDDTTAPLYISIPEALDIDRNVSHSFAPDRGYTLDIQTTFARVVRRECFDLVADPKVQNSDDGFCATKVVGSAKQLAKNLVNRAASQLAAYTQLIDALGRAPAPRVIVAFSAGVALGVDRGSFAELEPVSLAAAKAGVQLYALVEVPDAGDINDIGTERAAARREEDAFLTAGVQTVATAAGGETFKVVGQADRFFTRIVSETSGMYELGVQAPASPARADFVNVNVSVSRPGLTVRTKAHALAPAADSASTTARRASRPLNIDEALQARLAQGGAAFGVPVALATALRQDPASAQLQLGVSVQIPAVVSGPLTAMFAIVNGQGRVVQQGRREIPPSASDRDYQVAFPATVDPGPYRLRVAVADAAGNIGSLEQPVAAELARLGTCRVSDLFTTWSGADGMPRSLALEPLPERAASLRVSLELYPDHASAAAALTVRLALVAEGEADPLVERDLTPTGNGPMRMVAASIPADRLKPGAYTIRATILESGAVIGAVSTSITRQ